MRKLLSLLAGLSLLAALPACRNTAGDSQTRAAGDSLRYQPKPYVELRHPDWSKNATIYEVNVRQYTPEGTFKAFETHLPRLKEMGVDILWLMPIHPIGQLKRKGKMGSYYAVQDYRAVNPEFGTMDDLKALVKKAHGMGMHVIIDWVGNHTAWDNVLVKEHPDWYTHTPEGDFQPTPWYDWDDIIDLDYEKPALRRYMTDALKFWVKEADIDGYRCDVAGFIPVDFWDNARAEMDSIKPVFMLAEWESRDMQKRAFDMTYSWTLWEKMHGIVREGRPVAGLVEYLAHDVGAFPRDGYRMLFVDNHDMNSWNGNQIKNFGPALNACIVLTGTANGMPLCYSGQEAGLDRSLKFFDKDVIAWKPSPVGTLYKQIFTLKHEHEALWNGHWGGEMQRIFNDQPSVISFAREAGGDKVISVINFSSKPVTVKLKSKYQRGTYAEYFSGKEVAFKGDDAMTLGPWGYQVLVRKKGGEVAEE